MYNRFEFRLPEFELRVVTYPLDFLKVEHGIGSPGYRKHSDRLQKPPARLQKAARPSLVYNLP